MTNQSQPASQPQPQSHQPALVTPPAAPPMPTVAPLPPMHIDQQLIGYIEKAAKPANEKRG